MLHTPIVIATVAVAVLSWGATPSYAAEPETQGWWTATDPGGLPAQPPAAPDVPPDGLLVESGSTSPAAYAAVHYPLLQGESATTLTLKVAPDTVTTPMATLVLCPLDSPTFSPEQGGPIANAPSYDCTKKVTVPIDSGGTSFAADVASLAADGALALALIPGDSPTRVVLSKPDSASLEATSAPSEVPDSGSSTSAPVSLDLDEGDTSRNPSLLPAAPAPPLGPSFVANEQPPVVATAPAAPGPEQPVSAEPLASVARGGNETSQVALGLILGGAVAAGVLWAVAGASAGRSLAGATESPPASGTQQD